MTISKKDINQLVALHKKKNVSQWVLSDRYLFLNLDSSDRLLLRRIVGETPGKMRVRAHTAEMFPPEVRREEVAYPIYEQFARFRQGDHPDPYAAEMLELFNSRVEWDTPGSAKRAVDKRRNELSGLKPRPQRTRGPVQKALLGYHTEQWVEEDGDYWGNFQPDGPTTAELLWNEDGSYTLHIECLR